MLRSLIFATLLMPTASLAQSLWEAGGARVETVIYTCDRAFEELSVAYFTAPDATSFAAVQVAGQVHAMVQEISGSGVRFVDTDVQSGYRLHAKGDDLLILKQDPAQVTEEQLLAECRAKRPD